MVYDKQVGTHKVVRRWLRANLCSAVGTSFVGFRSWFVSTKPAGEACVAVRVSALKNVWFVKRFDADLAQYEISQVFDVPLEGLDQRWRGDLRHFVMNSQRLSFGRGD